MNNEKYIDIKIDAIEVNRLDFYFKSLKIGRKFYDSTIIKSTHIIGQKGGLDKLYFEILLEYHDEVVSLEFYGVSDIVSESSLSYFPEIREIKICKHEDRLNCKFIPTWGNKFIEFKFNELDALSYLLKRKERGAVLGNL